MDSDLLTPRPTLVSRKKGLRRIEKGCSIISLFENVLLTDAIQHHQVNLDRESVKGKAKLVVFKTEIIHSFSMTWVYSIRQVLVSPMPGWARMSLSNDTTETFMVTLLLFFLALFSLACLYVYMLVE